MLTEGKVRMIAIQVAASLIGKIKPNVSEEQIKNAVEEVIHQMQEAGELTGGAVSDERIEAAVLKYLTEHPIESPDAAASAEQAAKSAEESAKSASEAGTAATEAASSASSAASSASGASGSAATAQTAATAATEAKTAAETAKGQAQTAGSGAQAARTAAEAAKAGAEQSASAAAKSAEDAESAKTDARTAQTAAETAKATATQKAAEAEHAAQTATGKATEAAEANVAAQSARSNAEKSATNAASSASAANQAKTAAETAKGGAESAKAAATQQATAAEDSAQAAATKAAEAANAATRAEASARAAAVVEQRAANGEFDGKDGYTPMAGVDYPTEEQIKTYIRNEVSAVTAEDFPKVDSVEKMTDPSKIYIKVKEGEEPYFWAYVTLRSPGGIEPDGFTDVLATAIDTDGSIYNGIGYKNGWRVNSSGVEVELSNASVTGFIACKRGDTIYMKGIQKHTANGQAMPYKTDFTKYGNPIYNSAMTEHGDGTISFTAALGDSTGYIRIVGLNPFAADAVVSVNNPIKYKEIEPFEYQEWRAIYPVSVTDHTAEIKALQEKVREQEYDIEILKQGTTGAVDIRTWDKPIHDTEPVVLIGDDTDPTKAKPAVGNRDTVESVYAAYDALMVKHPLYITRALLGYDASGTLPIYRYDFMAPKPHEYTGGKNPAIQRPKAILISGIHKEMVGVWSLYYALEEIMTNPALRDVKRNAHLIVVPMCNPYAINGEYSATNHRKNANGVEIHRNFTVDHQVIDSSSNNYGGTEPLSEVESQYIDRIMKENTDAAFFASCHNFDGRDTSKPFGQSGGGSDYGTTFVWPSTATTYMYNLGGRLGVKMSEAWEDRYGDAWRAQIDAIRAARAAAGLTYQPEGDYSVVHVGVSTSPGTEAKQCLLYGIQGATVEVGGNMMALNTVNADSTTVTRGAEVYINLIKTGLACYNCRDKDEYAPIPAYELER